MTAFPLLHQSCRTSILTLLLYGNILSRIGDGVFLAPNSFLGRRHYRMTLKGLKHAIERQCLQHMTKTLIKMGSANVTQP